MQENIQIQDLQFDYVLELEDTTVTTIYGGVLGGLGDAFEAIYNKGKDFGETVANTLGY
jgi:hypothetical protein